MKNLMLSLVLLICMTAAANANQGMLALFADTNNRECHTTLGVGQVGNLYLMYVRGDGPRMGNAYEFKLLTSTPGTVFLSPVWPSSIIITIGTLETGISLCAQPCFPDLDYVPLGTIPIMNVSDPDTFTVKVVPDPAQVPLHEIVIVKCEPGAPLYAVLGGMFVFNAGCYSPEDPYGAIATKPTTWGAVKDLYR
jgi:hypothetical protein